MVPPRGAVTGTPLGDSFFLIFFVLDYGMSAHFNVESKSLWRGIAGWSYIHTPLS